MRHVGKGMEQEGSRLVQHTTAYAAHNGMLRQLKLRVSIYRSAEMPGELLVTSHVPSCDWGELRYPALAVPGAGNLANTTPRAT